VAVTTIRLQADEYFALVDELPRFTELIDGEVVVNTPTFRHQEILGFLYVGLVLWTREQPGRGRAGLSLNVHLGDDHVFAPDALWFAAPHVPAGDVARVEAPPDLAVEVRSPSTWRFDVGVKKSVYESSGLPELWLVDTQADTVLVFRRSSAESPDFDIALELGAGETLTSPQLSGFALDVAELFDR
jgi:Uma2 family endonuclease